MYAKAGDSITSVARAKLGMARGMTGPWPDATVALKTPGGNGQWVCVTCGQTFENNAQAMGHEADHGRHRLAWLSFTTQNIEEA